MSNILVIDSGNTNLKFVFYGKRKKETLVSSYDEENKNKFYKNKFFKNNIKKIFIGSVCWKKAEKTLNNLKNNFSVEIVKITSQDFVNNLDLKKYDVKTIGSDILALALYVKTNFVSGIAICFGTAYFAVLVKKGKLDGVIIAPSIEQGVDNFLHSTEMIKKTPDKFLKKISGINTITAIQSGYYHMINGFIKSVTTETKTKNKNVILTGGKINIYKNVLESKKFDYIDNCIVDGYKILVDKIHTKE